jgi:hypothetical protein
MRELADGRRWDEAAARVALQAWRASGLTGKRFAMKHGFDPQRLFWWRKRLDEGKVVADALRLIPTEIVGHPEFLRKGVVVRAPGGVAIELDSEAVSPSWLAALTRELVKE